MYEVKRANSSEHILRFSPEMLKEERTLEIEGKIRKAYKEKNWALDLAKDLMGDMRPGQ